VNKQIELAKLRVQQLQLKLQAQKLAADLNFILNSFQSMSTFSVQFIWFDNRINDYRKEVASKNSRLTFKLEEIQNYNVWWEKVFVKTLIIHISILSATRNSSVQQISLRVIIKEYDKSKMKQFLTFFLQWSTSQSVAQSKNKLMLIKK